MPRCNHHHKDCVQRVVECSFEEYMQQHKLNKANPYLQCKCIQDQRLLNLSNKFIDEPRYLSINKNDNSSLSNEGKVYYYKKKKIKHPKKFMTRIFYEKSHSTEVY